MLTPPPLTVSSTPAGISVVWFPGWRLVYLSEETVVLTSTMLLGVPVGPERPVASAAAKTTSFPAGSSLFQLVLVDQLSSAPSPDQVVTAAEAPWMAMAQARAGVAWSRKWGRKEETRRRVLFFHGWV